MTDFSNRSIVRLRKSLNLLCNTPKTPKASAMAFPSEKTAHLAMFSFDFGVSSASLQADSPSLLDLKNVDDIQSAIHYEQVSSNLVLPCRVYITFFAIKSIGKVPNIAARRGPFEVSVRPAA